MGRLPVKLDYINLRQLLNGAVQILDPTVIKPALTPGGFRARLYREAAFFDRAVRVSIPQSPYVVFQAYNPWGMDDERWLKVEKELTVGCRCPSRSYLTGHGSDCPMGNHLLALSEFKRQTWALITARQGAVGPSQGLSSPPARTSSGSTAVAPDDLEDAYADVAEDDYADQQPVGWERGADGGWVRSTPLPAVLTPAPLPDLAVVELPPLDA